MKLILKVITFGVLLSLAMLAISAGVSLYLLQQDMQTINQNIIENGKIIDQIQDSIDTRKKRMDEQLDNL